MARNIRMISPIVPATILEHHERRTGQGFPYCRGAGMISTVSEVIGIVDMFLNIMKESAKTPEFNIASHMQKVVYNQFSFQVMDAFDKTFFKALSSPASAS
jgi:HD-GYP domain-containing protein (c-di-GMP phosphodiesterase class II)